MPIDGINLELRELGKLKLGEELPDRPRALDTWRLVSPHKDLIRAAYELYGGNPRDNGDGTYEVITETAELDVLLPPQDLAANQWFEHWQAGGLQRRCTGTALIEFDQNEPLGYRKVAPCLCEEENLAKPICKPTTVLRVVLPELPDIGIWRLTTKSIYAARELPGVTALILESSASPLPPAVLGIDSRTQKRPGEKPHHYKIPVIRSRGRLTELLEANPAEMLPAPAPTTENKPAEALSRPQEPSNEVSAPTRPESPLGPEWNAIGALLTEVTPDTVPGMGLPRMIHNLERLERAMRAVHLWPEGELQNLAERWLGPGKVNWRDSMGHDIKAFTMRALMHATKEVEDTGLGARALQRHRHNEEKTDAGQRT